ncbi:hypothetical protein L1049_022632 [Liquidambar formosana]|uniref:RING-type E3 ubiquitin transferase n=1 Tax=Liquidambar formosana TaxID=63359 RepID=A0AAP0REU0_LIQFO
MGDNSTTPPPPPAAKSNLPMLYYGLVVVGTAALMLAMYNLIVVRWCTAGGRRPRRRPNQFVEATTSQSFESSSVNLVSSFKYRKEGVSQGKSTSDYECAVCLSVFEDGEDVRKLPRCKHSFHAPCIDMWLYSHSDCPLCRAHVEVLVSHHQDRVVQEENSMEISREGLLDSGMSV